MVSRRFRGGLGPRSNCPSLKSSDDCQGDSGCRWDNKSLKCRKRSVRKATAAAGVRVGCPGLDAATCASNVDCAWNEKTSKCRKRSVRKKVAAAAPKMSVRCPGLDAASCASNADCAWNEKTSKCRKRSVRKVAAAPKVRVGCPGLDAASCAASADCAWNDKTGKCRKSRSTKKAAAVVAANVSPVAAAVVSQSPSSPVSPKTIPKDKKCRNLDLTNGSFVGLDLSHAVFVECDLRGANFRGANLTNARLAMSQLDGADFTGARFLHTAIVGCECGSSHDNGTKPVPTIFAGVSMRSVEFDRTQFNYADFRGASFNNCLFRDVSAKNANFTRCQFTNNQINECTFRLCNFEEVIFDPSTELGNDDFRPKCVENGNGCYNYFNGCNFKGAQFPINTQNCNFSDTYLIGSNISDPQINIEGSYFDELVDADDLADLKRRALGPEEEDEEWNEVAREVLVKQKTPSPVKKVSKKQSPVKVAAPVAAAAATGCVKQTQKKYLERPSPPYSAADCCGMTMQGNDGKLYTSVANAKGVCAWKLAKN